MRTPLAAAVLAGGLLGAAPARAACAGRPTDPGGYQGYAYGAAEVRSFAPGRVRVHWAIAGTHAPDPSSGRRDGVPDAVARVAETADAALTAYAAMGYRAIPSDAACPSNGGDEKVDLYLVRFAGADGSTVAECNAGICSSFALVESTFAGKGYATPDEGFRTVVSHELFHAVQNAYEATGQPAAEPFWTEGTAQWAMKTLHPELEDFERQLPAFFADPSRSIDAPSGGVTAGFLYGSAVWPLFLASRHGPETIRQIVEARGDSVGVLAATDAVLRTKGSSLAATYPLFAAWNVATGKLAGAAGYREASRYPGIRTAELGDGASAVTSGLAYFAFRGVLDQSYRIALETDPERNGGVVVPIVAGRAELDRATPLPAEASGEVVVVVSGVTAKKTDAPFVIRLLAPGAATPAPPAVDEGCTAVPRRQVDPRTGELLGAAILALAAARRRQRSASAAGR